ncbi:MAG TPA: hypothetical protein DCF68_05095, partial [Cyanothece sp. UBA12306]|nr:hypothetical protein [Cyanothece sp. UBA12306]
MNSAYLLVTHGSRDRRPQIAVEQLAQLVKQQLSIKEQQLIPLYSSTVKSSTALLSPPSSPLIETASLELTSISLYQRIEQLGQKASKLNLTNLKIIPLFLLPGVHVTEDIPKEVAIAQQRLGQQVRIKLSPYLGSYQGLPQLLAQQFEKHSREGKILIAHGSRYPKAHHPINAIAKQ